MSPQMEPLGFKGRGKPCLLIKRNRTPAYCYGAIAHSDYREFARALDSGLDSCRVERHFRLGRRVVAVSCAA
jgi:hypothetical protein